jgi:hypothetical protein
MRRAFPAASAWPASPRTRTARGQRRRRVAAQPDKWLHDAKAELLGEHPGGLIDLGPVPRQIRRP